MEEINLYKLLGFYARNWLLIISLTLAGLLVGLVYNQFIQVPMYKSNATLLVIKDTNSAQDATLLNNYVELFQSRRVLEPAISAQNLDVSYETMSHNVTAVNEKSTEVLRVSASTDNPETSQKFLASAVESFRGEAEELYGKRNIIVVDNASDAVPPYNVNKPLQLAIASGAGFVVSLLVLFFIYDARGGKVDNWGKRNPRTAKRSSAPRKKNTPTAKLDSKAIKNAEATSGTLWQRFMLSAKNGTWLAASDAELNPPDQPDK